MKIKISICTILFLLFATACAATPAEPTATPVDLEALKTEIAATFFTSMTETAAAFTPTPEEPTITPTLAATLTPSIIDTPTIIITPTEVLCDQMVFVSDVTIPDKTEMSPGQEFIKTWKVKNIGSCAWKPNYRLIFAYGNPAVDGKMSGDTTALTAEIAAGAEGEVSVKFKAPTPLGTYTGNWRLQNNNGFNFGDPLIVVIVVK